MIHDVHFPQKVRGGQLDAYLAMGWYRIGQVIFTTHHIPHSSGWYRVMWLRYVLQRIRLGKKQQQVLRMNAGFDVVINPFSLSEELEDLYLLYRSHISFPASETLHQSLFDHSVHGVENGPVFDSFVTEVRDKGKLVAAGIFDCGLKSIAGILNFFDPAYKKFSPGKFLMLQKIQYARQQGMDHYYPGYIAADYPKFDYKLFAGADAAEIYDPISRKWLPYSTKLIHDLKDTLVEPPAEPL